MYWKSNLDGLGKALCQTIYPQGGQTINQERRVPRGRYVVFLYPTEDPVESTIGFKIGFTSKQGDFKYPYVRDKLLIDCIASDSHHTPKRLT